MDMNCSLVTFQWCSLLDDDNDFRDWAKCSEHNNGFRLLSKDLSLRVGPPRVSPPPYSHLASCPLALQAPYRVADLHLYHRPSLSLRHAARRAIKNSCHKHHLGW